METKYLPAVFAWLAKDGSQRMMIGHANLEIILSEDKQVSEIAQALALVLEI